MSFMTLTRSPSTEGVTEKETTLFAEEGSDPVEENREISKVAALVTEAYESAKTQRRPKEEAWLRIYQNYRGSYGPSTRFREDEKSRAFVKITKTKVHAAHNQIMDVLFAGSKFPLGFEALNDPVAVAEMVSVDPPKPPQVPEMPKAKPSRFGRPELDEMMGSFLEEKLADVSEDVQEGPGTTPQSAMWEPAKIAARKMEDKVHDQLENSDAAKHLGYLVFEACLLGTGVLKGPFAVTREHARWASDGSYDPIKEDHPEITARSIWDIYPDPDARNIEECLFIVDRHRMTRSQLRKLKSRPMFRKESIEEAVALGPNYVAEPWEAALSDHASISTDPTRFEVLEYWGMIDAEEAREAGLTIPKDIDDDEEIQANIWVCNGQLLRLVLNPFQPTRLPYYIVPYEANPYSVFGVGVGENMEDTQLLMNGFLRMAVDNAALSGNILIEMDEANLVPGQDLSIHPGKIFRRQSGAPGQGLFATKFPNISNELFMMFDKARQLADEATGMPSFSHGISGVMGVGRTASGMSMLMGAASQNIKGVVRNIDDFLLTRLGEAFFAFNMQFHFDEEFARGDIITKARGTESLVRNEVRSQRLLQFMQLTANPVMQPFVKYDYILRELAASMDLDEEKILNDPREALLQARMMAEVMGPMNAAPAPGAASGGPPPVSDPTGNGGGTIAPGAAPEPGAAGFTGEGGGANAMPPQEGAISGP